MKARIVTRWERSVVDGDGQLPRLEVTTQEPKPIADWHAVTVQVFPVFKYR